MCLNFGVQVSYGELYNVKFDDMDLRDEDCIDNYLEFKDEEPKVIAHRYIEDMTEKYGDYKKVSINNRHLKK